MIPKIINFIKIDIWRMRIKNLSRGKSFLVKQLRVILAALKGFNEDKCQLRASALTFYSLLSIVPVVAMLFGIAKGFGLEKMLEDKILENLPGQEEVLMKVITFAQTLLDSTKGGLVAGIGVAVLFWTVIKVLGNIEKSFNDIWGIKEARTLGRKFSDYLSIMLICPLLLILSSSATVFIATQITLITEKFTFIGVFGPMILFFLNFLPYCVIWVLFTFIYVYMPNTKVKFKSAIIAGVLSGTIYQVVQWAYISFQIGAAKYNAIYGSFAALPLFLIWLQLSWLIVLFGAEISFAHQNADTYEFEPDCLMVSRGFKRLIMLQIMTLIVKRFSRGDKPLTASEIAHIIEMPIRLIRQLLYELTESSLISENCTKEHKEFAYQPAADIDKFTIHYIINSLEKSGSDNIPIVQTKEINVLIESLQNFDNSLKNSPDNKCLKDL